MAKRVQLTERPKAKKKGLKSSKPKNVKPKKKVRVTPREKPLTEIMFEQALDTLTRTASAEVTAWTAPTIAHNTTTKEDAIVWLGNPRRVPRQHSQAQQNFKLMAMQVIGAIKDSNVGMRHHEFKDVPTCKVHS